MERRLDKSAVYTRIIALFRFRPALIRAEAYRKGQGMAGTTVICQRQHRALAGPIN